MLEMNYAWETFYFVSSVCLAGLNYMDKVSNVYAEPGEESLLHRAEHKSTKTNSLRCCSCI